MCRQEMTYAELRRALADGRLTRIRHGAVVEGPVQQDQRRRQLELIAGTVPVLSGDTWVLSHTSAVAALGLPMTQDGADSVWITRPPGSQAHRRPPLITRVCPLRDGDVTRADGFRVTSLERTAVDMSRQFGFVTGTMIADAALSAGATPASLGTAVNRTSGWRGNDMARKVVAFADGRSESPGESLMRAMLGQLKYPPTDLQVVIHDRHGHFVARCDYGWLEYGVVGEYDGPQKYLRDLRPGVSLSEAVVMEKAREARIRDQGLELIRFCRADLKNPVAAVARLKRLLDQRGLLPTPWTNPAILAPADEAPW